LGSVVEKNGKILNEINERIWKASNVIIWQRVYYGIKIWTENLKLQHSMCIKKNTIVLSIDMDMC
jgi:hypothetical protein